MDELAVQVVQVDAVAEPVEIESFGIVAVAVAVVVADFD